MFGRCRNRIETQKKSDEGKIDPSLRWDDQDFQGEEVMKDEWAGFFL